MVCILFFSEHFNHQTFLQSISLTSGSIGLFVIIDKKYSWEVKALGRLDPKFCANQWYNLR